MERLLRRTGETKTEAFSRPSADRYANLRPHKRTRSTARRQSRSGCDPPAGARASLAPPRPETTDAARRLQPSGVAQTSRCRASIRAAVLDRYSPAPSRELRAEKADR